MSKLHSTRKEWADDLDSQISRYPIVYVVEDIDERLADKFRRDQRRRDRKTAKQHTKLMRWALKGARHGRSC